MYRLLRRIALGTGLVLLGAAAAVFFLYRAATAPVPEYQRLLEQTRRQLESGELDESRQQLESQLAALYSDTQNLESWETVVTAEQVNGWLATQLDQDFPELAEQGVFDPRMLLKPNEATLAMRVELHGVEAVVALDLHPFVAEDGSLAIELLGARVGSAPLPIGQILDRLEKSLGEEGLPGRWAQNEGRPVLLVDVDWSTSDRRHSLEVVEVRDGEIYASGTSSELAPRVAQRSLSLPAPGQ